jgi:hypothetical protein
MFQKLDNASAFRQKAYLLSPLDELASEMEVNV